MFEGEGGREKESQVKKEREKRKEGREKGRERAEKMKQNFYFPVQRENVEKV